MTVHWTHDTLTDHTQIIDGLGRRFTYQAGRFLYGSHYIMSADIEWPVTSRTEASR